MELMFRWLEGLAGEEGRRLGQSVSALPGRSTFGSGSGDPFDAAEFSEREGAGTLRMAWTALTGKRHLPHGAHAIARDAQAEEAARAA